MIVISWADYLTLTFCVIGLALFAFVHASKILKTYRQIGLFAATFVIHASFMVFILARMVGAFIQGLF